jgi:hypothetical protein
MTPEQEDELEFLKKLNAMPITGTCDSKSCDKPATRWFGRTSCATCGDQKCIAELQYEYDNMVVSSDDEW